MDPLTAMKQWYDAGEESMREEFVLLVQKFHIMPSLEGLNTQMYMDEFSGYMDRSGLNKAEIVQRAIFMKGLINFGIAGRDTEEGWERARRKNEEVAHKLHADSKEAANSYVEFLKDYGIRKDRWIAWCHVWRSLERDMISDDRIGYWYYMEEVINAGLKSIQ